MSKGPPVFEGACHSAQKNRIVLLLLLLLLLLPFVGDSIRDASAASLSFNISVITALMVITIKCLNSEVAVEHTWIGFVWWGYGYDYDNRC